MLRFDSTKWIVSLVLLAIIAVAVTISIDSFTAQTAVGQASDDDFQYLERANRAFIEVVDRGKPAVVQIATKKIVTARRSRGPFDFFDDDFFEWYFGVPRDGRERRNRNQPPEEEEREVPGGLGSGVIVSEDGYILTNNHVIEGANEIQVILPGGREPYDATVVGRDSGAQGTDLAVLKIDGKDLPTLEFGDSDKLEVGEWVIAAGSPFGLAQTVTRGMVSAKGRSSNDVRIVEYADFIQTDAAINRGNSGGALINIRGELIGINTAIATGGGFGQGNVGVGFAIPSNLAKRIMNDLIENGEVERGWLGVELQTVTHDLAQELKLEEPRGILITRVGKNSPAEKGGIQHSDVIIEFDNIQIRDVKHLRQVVAGTDVGKAVEIKVIRKGEEKVLKVKLGKRTEEVVAALRTPRDETFAGIHVRDLADELAEQYEHEGEKGVVVVGVERRSPAARAGIREGDLIQEIDWEEISNVDEYRQQLKAVADKSTVVLYVKHARGLPEYVTLKNINRQDR